MTGIKRRSEKNGHINYVQCLKTINSKQFSSNIMKDLGRKFTNWL